MVCQKTACPGGGLTGLIIPIEGQVNTNSTGTTYQQPQQQTASKEAGLCILLMDASGSMGDSAYRDYSFPSKYGGDKLTKREVITDVAAKAIFELEPMSKKDSAYLCAIKFDHRQAVMFTDTVTNILNQHGTAQNLAKYLHDELAEFNGGTDINSALKMAHSFVDKFLAGSITGMGNYIPIYHTQFAPKSNKSIDVPNVRVLIYTDGEQLSEYGPIINPFKNMEPDLLMGAYVGQESEKGCRDLKSVIGNCIIHGTPQFFVLDNPQKIATLRGLFRMASGTSGFCPTCINTVSLR
jgi:hypothetical protein